jgi:aspartyl-tRNA(Asn)/glutamyl-tRNA(Gln) amidotransferase subunit A
VSTTTVERVTTALEAAHATQGALNAFTSIDDERALSRADELDSLGHPDAQAGPLTGLPVALKDLIDHEGRTTTSGSAFYRNQATATAPAVARLEAAGAVVIGRTGLHEFAFGFTSENPHFGPVRNPWDPSTSPGGSSGGSAVAVAAGITPLAIGTDTGGSVRVPAALCGCYGLKVTHGRVPLEGVFPLALSVDTVGPLAASIETLDAGYRALSADTSTEPAVAGLQIGVPQPWFDAGPMDEEVRRAFDMVIGRLIALGHRVTPVVMPDVLPSPALIEAIAGEISGVHAGFRAAGLPYGEDVARRLDECSAVGAEEIEAGRKWQLMIRGRFAEAFRSFDLLITPTTPVMRKQIGIDTIGDRHHRAVLSWFSAIVNHSLHPAIAIPLAGTGTPPVSLQAIGPLDSETALIGFGRSLQRAGVAGFTPAPMGGGNA